MAVVSKVLALAILATTVFSNALSGRIVPITLKGLGLVLVAALAYQLVNVGRTATEVKLYFAFILWAVISALVVADDVSLSLRAGWTAFQTGLLFWGVVVAHQRHPDLRIVMGGLWVLGVGFALLAYASPELAATLSAGGQRMSVTGENPNFTGQVFVFAVFAAIYLGERAVKWPTKLLVLGPIPLLVPLLLSTGSRKMGVAAIVVGATWVLASKRVRMAHGRSLVARVLIILVIAGAGVVALSSWEGSVMANRWELLQDPGYTGGTTVRESMARQGVRLFLENPIAGVGLSNQVIKMGSFAHSDYVDVVASTGLVGAALYFAIYVVAFRRARRVSRRSQGTLSLDWRAFLTYMALLAWLMTGFLRYNDLLNVVVLGSFIGCFLGRERIAARAGERILNHGAVMATPRLKLRGSSGDRHHGRMDASNV